MGHRKPARYSAVAVTVNGHVFEDRIISRRADDTELMKYYLWGPVKDKFYVDNSETIDALKDNIGEAIGEIDLHTIDNVLKNWIARAGYCIANRNSHLNEIIFHSIIFHNPEGLYFQIK